MAQFRKEPFGKYTSFIYLLLVLVIAEFIGLAGALAFDPIAENIPADEPEPEIEELTGTIPVQADVAKPMEPVEKPKPAGELSGPEILAQNQFIAHGLGAVDGINILNCREGFEAMYKQGVRVFEADLRLTKDARLILRHDWRWGWQGNFSEVNIPTLKEFTTEPILEKYTPLSFRDLLFILKDYPDICIITDTKFAEDEIVQIQFDAMRAEAEDLGLSYLLDRVIVQFYNQLMYTSVDNIHHFAGYIYTLYQEKFNGSQEEFRRFAEFCAENENIVGITIDETIWRPEYAGIAKEYGLKIFSHTIDSPDRARALFEDGIDAVYTNSLTPELFPPAETAGTTTEGDM